MKRLGRIASIIALAALCLCFRAEVAGAQSTDCTNATEVMDKVRAHRAYVSEKELSAAEFKIALDLASRGAGDGPERADFGYLVLRADGVLVFFYGNGDAICGSFLIPPPAVPYFLDAVQGEKS